MITSRSELERTSQKPTTALLTQTNFFVCLNRLSNSLRQLIQRLLSSNDHLEVSVTAASIAQKSTLEKSTSPDISPTTVAGHNKTDNPSFLSSVDLHDLRSLLTHKHTKRKIKLADWYQQEVYQFVLSKLPDTLTNDEIDALIKQYGRKFDQEIKKADETYNLYLQYLEQLIGQRYHDNFGISLNTGTEPKIGEHGGKRSFYSLEILAQLIQEVDSEESPGNSTQIRLIKESYPTRCDVCHQADLFTPQLNMCLRCIFV